MMTKILCVGVGGFVGSILRFLLTIALNKQIISFSYGTLSANIIGCLVIGILTEFAVHSELISIESKLLLVTGLCGGLTTMSAFIYEIAQLLKNKEIFYFIIYMNVTIIGSFTAYYLGSLVVRFFISSSLPEVNNF